MDLRKALAGDGAEAFRERLIDTLKRCLFCVPSLERHRTVHGGVYDYGLLGCCIKSNVLELWHRHFVLEEHMREVCCPYDKAELHVVDDNFNVLIVCDGKTGSHYRADQLLRDFCNEKLKSLSISAGMAEELQQVVETLYLLSHEELWAKIKDYGVTAPDTKNPLSDPCPLKLMFQTPIGESGFNLGKYLQWMSSQISLSRGLIVHEFTVSEIRHFFDPEDKRNPKFSAVECVETFLLPEEQQRFGETAIKSQLGQAVLGGTVENETLGYFIGRVFLFVTCLGIDKEHLRFRQRVRKEMACHATDCWVAEIECSYGWIECVDIADWSSYDLSKHTGKSGVALLDNEKLTEAREEVEKSGVALLDNGELIETREGVKLEINEKELGHAFEGNQKIVVESLLAMSEEEALLMKAALVSKGEAAFHVRTLGKTVTIKDNMVDLCKKRMREPKRMRPSKAGDEQVNVFRFPPLVAPIKCAVFQLRKKPEYKSVGEHISRSLTAAGVFHREYTAGNTTGKMFAKTDELGVPYAITVHSQVDATIRDRDSKDQVRVSVREAASVVKKMINGHKDLVQYMVEFPTLYIYFC